MENFTPAPSQETASPVLPKYQGDQSNSCPPSSPSLPPTNAATKPRKPPTVTPRTFTRFFTPKTSSRQWEKPGSSRRALRDITTSGANRKRQVYSSHKLETPDTLQYGSDGHRTKRRKTKAPQSPQFPPEASSPLKRICSPAHDVLSDDDELSIGPEHKDGDDREELELHEKPGSIELQSIRYSKARGYLGSQSQRELGIPGQRGSTFAHKQISPDWQFETSNFYSKPEDSHVCMEVASRVHHTVPFCAVGCRTNSLVAVGDEDGGVRLLDTAADSKPSFDASWVKFKAHSNAILDLDFSPDDKLLATASGDQTSQVIDMPTQQAIYTMAGHVASVKHIRFQPESSNVLASSSRDGSVQLWDLRCKGFDVPIADIKVPLDPTSTPQPSSHNKMTWARSINTILNAHGSQQTGSNLAPAPVHDPSLKALATSDAPSKTEAPGRRGDVSVTSIAFLPAPRSDLLLTASEMNASVKLWDIRKTYQSRRSGRTATPISTIRQPESHSRHRNFGLTSLSVSGDGSRLYTLCRDNTVYTYSTSHLIVGQAPELSADAFTQRNRSMRRTAEKEGLGPLYGFRNSKFHATTFYVSSSLRQARGDRSELLAVGSSDGCAVLFPTDERYLRSVQSERPVERGAGLNMRGGRPALHRTDSGLSTRLSDTIPIFEHGTALVRGHSREVTGLTWTYGGDLVTAGDDFTVRCWREDDSGVARTLRIGGEGEGRRWGCGWAEVQEGWDDDEC